MKKLVYLLFYCFVQVISADASEPATLRIGYDSEPVSFDWQESYDTTSMPLLNALMDGLTKYVDVKGAIAVRPALAESFKSYDAGKRWIFTLRKQIEWTDGKELVADDFVKSYRRLLDPKFASQTLDSVLVLKNAKKYQQAKLADFSQVGIRAIEKYKLEFQLEEPILYFPSLLANPSMFPVRTDLIEKFGKRWIEPANIATLGAYKLTKYEPGKSIELKKNQRYWDNRPSVETLQILVITENNTARDLFMSGRLDVAPLLDHTSVLQDLEKPELVKANTSVVAYYVFNQTKKPLDKALVRRALVHAVDRNQIIKALGGDRHSIKSWLPSALEEFNPKIGLEFNPSLARELIKKAGYKSPADVPAIDLYYNVSENHRKVAENFQYQVKANLGVLVNIKQVEWKLFISEVQKKTPGIYRWGWVVDSPSAVPGLDLMKSDSEANYTKWKNEEYDRLLGEIRNEANPKKRKLLADRMQRILVEEEAIVFPQYEGVYYFLVKPRVRSFKVDSMGVFDLKSLQVVN